MSLDPPSPAQQFMFLFGGDSPWIPSEWTDSDDRVRGGNSQSHITSSESGAVFSGHLDTSTLGGAGFASQRTVDSQEWDLSGYEALVLDVSKSDGKKYTLILKDTVAPPRPDGREQSTVGWEYDFAPGLGADKVAMPLQDFRPTYRGKPSPRAEPLDLARVKRVSFMMRSFFGQQEGDFSLSMRWLAAVKLGDDDYVSQDEAGLAKEAKDGRGREERSTRRSWRDWLCVWI